MSCESLFGAPEEMLRINCSIEEFLHFKDLNRRRIYLTREINTLDNEEGLNGYLSETGQIIKSILDFNEQDQGLDLDKRQPIKLFLDSPGGDISQGFPLIAAIELSKTPIYTVNIGKWASMAFWIGIAGHKRFALPYTEFLHHDGTLFTAGTAGSVQDTIDFSKRFKDEIIKKHVLRHSRMDSVEYDSLSRRENYMLPEDALKYGFIDEIIVDIDTIL